MKVLHIVNELWYGGIQEVVYHQILSQPHHDHTVLYHSGYEMSSAIAHAGARLVCMHKSYSDLYSHVQSEEYDIVHKQCGGGDVSEFLWPLKTLPCTIIESMHCPRDCKSPPDVVSAVLGASPTTTSLQTHNIPYYEVPYGIDPVDTGVSKEEARHLAGIPEDALVIGRLGRVTQSKLVHDAVNVAIHACAMRSAWFVLAGTAAPDDASAGTYDSTLTQLCSQNIPKFKRIVCNTHKEKALAIQTMDVFLYPTQGEGFGFIFLEAMAQGVPILTYDNNSNAHIIDGAGIVAAPRNTLGALLSLLDDTPLRKQLGDVGRQMTKGKYHYSRFGRKVDSIYEEFR